MSKPEKVTRKAERENHKMKRDGEELKSCKFLRVSA